MSSTTSFEPVDQHEPRERCTLRNEEHEEDVMHDQTEPTAHCKRRE